MHSENQPLAFGLDTFASVNEARVLLGKEPLVASGFVDTSLGFFPPSEFISFKGRGGGLAGFINRNIAHGKFNNAKWRRNRKGQFTGYMGGDVNLKDLWGKDENGRDTPNFTAVNVYADPTSDEVGGYGRVIKPLNNQQQDIVEVGHSVHDLGRKEAPTPREIALLGEGFPTDLKPGETRFVRMDPKQYDNITEESLKTGGKARLGESGEADDDLDPHEVLPLIEEMNAAAADLEADNPEAAQALRDAAGKLDEAADARDLDGQDRGVLAAQDALAEHRDVDPRVADLADRADKLLLFEEVGGRDEGPYEPYRAQGKGRAKQPDKKLAKELDDEVARAKARQGLIPVAKRQERADHARRVDAAQRAIAAYKDGQIDPAAAANARRIADDIDAGKLKARKQFGDALREVADGIDLPGEEGDDGLARKALDILPKMKPLPGGQDQRGKVANAVKGLANEPGDERRKQLRNALRDAKEGQPEDVQGKLDDLIGEAGGEKAAPGPRAVIETPETKATLPGGEAPEVPEEAPEVPEAEAPEVPEAEVPEAPEPEPAAPAARKGPYPNPDDDLPEGWQPLKDELGGPPRTWIGPNGEMLTKRRERGGAKREVWEYLENGKSVARSLDPNEVWAHIKKPEVPGESTAPEAPEGNYHEYDPDHKPIDVLGGDWTPVEPPGGYDPDDPMKPAQGVEKWDSPERGNSVLYAEDPESAQGVNKKWTLQDRDGNVIAESDDYGDLERVLYPDGDGPAPSPATPKAELPPAPEAEAPEVPEAEVPEAPEAEAKHWIQPGWVGPNGETVKVEPGKGRGKKALPQYVMYDADGNEIGRGDFDQMNDKVAEVGGDVGEGGVPEAPETPKAEIPEPSAPSEAGPVEPTNWFMPGWQGPNGEKVEVEQGEGEDALPEYVLRDADGNEIARGDMDQMNDAVDGLGGEGGAPEAADPDATPDAATAASSAKDAVEDSDVADVPEVQAAVDAIDSVVGPEGVKPEADSHSLSDAANIVDEGAIAASEAGDEDTAGALDDAADALEAEADVAADAEAGTPEAPPRVPLEDADPLIHRDPSNFFDFAEDAEYLNETKRQIEERSNGAGARHREASKRYKDAIAAGDEEAAAQALADMQQALSDWAAEAEALGEVNAARKARAQSRRIGTKLRKAGFPRTRIDRRNQPKARERRALALERKQERANLRGVRAKEKRDAAVAGFAERNGWEAVGGPEGEVYHSPDGQWSLANRNGQWELLNRQNGQTWNIRDDQSPQRQLRDAMSGKTPPDWGGPGSEEDLGPDEDLEEPYDLRAEEEISGAVDGWDGLTQQQKNALTRHFVEDHDGDVDAFLNDLAGNDSAEYADSLIEGAGGPGEVPPAVQDALDYLRRKLAGEPSAEAPEAEEAPEGGEVDWAAPIEDLVPTNPRAERALASVVSDWDSLSQEQRNALVRHYQEDLGGDLNAFTDSIMGWDSAEFADDLIAKGKRREARKAAKERREGQAPEAAPAVPDASVPPERVERADSAQARVGELKQQPIEDQVAELEAAIDEQNAVWDKDRGGKGKFNNVQNLRPKMDKLDKEAARRAFLNRLGGKEGHALDKAIEAGKGNNPEDFERLLDIARRARAIREAVGEQYEGAAGGEAGEAHLAERQAKWDAVQKFDEQFGGPPGGPGGPGGRGTSGWMYMDDYADEVDYSGGAPQVQAVRDALDAMRKDGQWPEQYEGAKALLNNALIDLDAWLAEGNFGKGVDKRREERFERIINNLNNGGANELRDRLLEMRYAQHGPDPDEWDLDNPMIEAALQKLRPFAGGGSPMGRIYKKAQGALGDALEAEPGSPQRWAALMRARNQLDLGHAEEAGPIMNALRVRQDPARVRPMDDPVFKLAEANIAPRRDMPRGKNWSTEEMNDLDAQIADLQNKAANAQGRQKQSYEKAAKTLAKAVEAYRKQNYGEFDAYYSMALNRALQAEGPKGELFQKLQGLRDAHWGAVDMAPFNDNKPKLKSLITDLPDRRQLTPDVPESERLRANAKGLIDNAMKHNDAAVQRVELENALWALRQANDPRDKELIELLEPFDPNADVLDPPGPNDPPISSKQTDTSITSDGSDDAPSLTHAEKVVDLANEQYGVLVEEVARDLGIPIKDAQPVLDRLEQLGFIERSGDTAHPFYHRTPKAQDRAALARAWAGEETETSEAPKAGAEQVHFLADAFLARNDWNATRHHEAFKVAKQALDEGNTEYAIAALKNAAARMGPADRQRVNAAIGQLEAERPALEDVTPDPVAKIQDAADRVVADFADEPTASALQNALNLARGGDVEGAKAELNRAANDLADRYGFGRGAPDPAHLAGLSKEDQLRAADAYAQLKDLQLGMEPWSVPERNAVMEDLRRGLGYYDPSTRRYKEAKGGPLQAMDAVQRGDRQGFHEALAGIKEAGNWQGALANPPLFRRGVEALPKDMHPLAQNANKLALGGDRLGADRLLHLAAQDAIARGDTQTYGLINSARTELLDGAKDYGTLKGVPGGSSLAVDMQDYKEAATRGDAADALQRAQDLRPKLAALAENGDLHGKPLTEDQRKVVDSMLINIDRLEPLLQAKVDADNLTPDPDVQHRPRPGRPDYYPDADGIGLQVGDEVERNGQLEKVVRIVAPGEEDVNFPRAGVYTWGSTGSKRVDSQDVKLAKGRADRVHPGQIIGAHTEEPKIENWQDWGRRRANQVLGAAKGKTPVKQLFNTEQPRTVRQQAAMDILQRPGVEFTNFPTIDDENQTITVNADFKSPRGASLGSGTITFRGGENPSIDVDLSGIPKTAAGQKMRAEVGKGLADYAIANNITTIREKVGKGGGNIAARGGADWDVEAEGGVDGLRKKLNKALSAAAKEATKSGDQKALTDIAALKQRIDGATDPTDLPTPWELANIGSNPSAPTGPHTAGLNAIDWNARYNLRPDDRVLQRMVDDGAVNLDWEVGNRQLTPTGQELLDRLKRKDGVKSLGPEWTAKKLGNGASWPYLFEHKLTGEKFIVKDRGKNGPVGGRIDFGKDGIVKEALTARVMRAMGSTSAPWSDENGDISVTEWAGHADPDIKPGTMKDFGEVNTSGLVEQLRDPDEVLRMAVADVITQNHDRHSQNAKIADTVDGKKAIFPVDHNFGMHPQLDYAMAQGDYGQFLRAGVAGPLLRQYFKKMDKELGNGSDAAIRDKIKVMLQGIATDPDLNASQSAVAKKYLQNVNSINMDQLMQALRAARW